MSNSVSQQEQGMAYGQKIETVTAEAMMSKEAIKGIEFDMNSLSSVTEYFIKAGVTKYNSSWFSRLILSMFAAWFVILGCILTITVAGGLEVGFRSTFPSITKALGGCVFTIALIFILFLGGDLFTGNCMTMTMCFIHGKLSIRQCAEVLIYTFCTNFAWCLFFSYFLAFQTNLFVKEPYNSMAIAIAFGKLSQPYGPTILKGIGANSLVCIGVILGTIARSDLGKVVLIFIPIATFATIGYEHVIANMGLIPIGMMYGADITPRHYFVDSMIPSCIGNWIGGGWLLGFPLVYLYAWKSRSIKHVGEFITFNFVPTTTIAEEWAIFTYKIWNNVEPQTEIIMAQKYTPEKEKV